MIFLMALDPLLQNGLILSLIIYVSDQHITSNSIEGCCVSYRITVALVFFTVLYILTTIIVNIFVTLEFLKALTPQSRSPTNILCVALCV
jgi:hypothetical protein